MIVRRSPTGSLRMVLLLAIVIAARVDSRLALGQPSASVAARPNILVILVDDLGYGDLSSYGAPDLRTPNIDRLVGEGMRFDRFYANCPVCSPTRAALLSGRYQELVGVPGVIRTHANNSWGYLSPNAVLMPQLLKQAGYATALIGKWHLGLTSPSTPNERGFGFFHGFLGDMMDDYYTHRRHDRNYMRHNADIIDPPGHATDLFSEWASAYLRRQRAERPFFLYLCYNAPHTPIQPPEAWVERIKRREPRISAKRAKLGALIEHLDDGIGRVLGTLAETGLDRNTIVVFTSDNGGQTSVGARNGPVRAGKGTLYEGGIRVPTAIRWPGRVQGGSRSSRALLSMDLMPTLLEAAGVAIHHEIDGRSFLPTLLGRDQPDPGRDLFFGRREGGRVFNGGTIEGVRRGDWKLLRSRPGGRWELYNLAEDPLEQTDVAARQPEVARALRTAMEAQLARYGTVPWQPPAR